MEYVPVTFKGNPTPKHGGDYKATTSGRYFRVFVRPPVKIPDHVQLAVQAYLVDVKGAFVPGSSGGPTSGPERIQPIHTSGMLAKQQTILPGWVLFRLAENQTISADTLPAQDGEGNALTWTKGTVDPTAADNPGKLGDCYCNTATNTFWQWDTGLLYRAHCDRMADLDARMGAGGPGEFF